ncbi:MAG: VOC family protein [Arenimonas sp.]
MRLVLALLVATLLSGTRAQAASPESGWQADRLDHLMLWTDNVDRTTSVLAVKLGFQVGPGGDFGDGVANRILRLGDQSYLELLYTTQPASELGEDLRKELAEVRAGTGAKTFALHPSELDRADAFLRSRGFELDPPSPMNYDPDGPGPKPSEPASWRTVEFVHSPFTFGGLFLISYAANRPVPADRAIRIEHPNGTTAWTSIWLLSSDLEADRKAFERMGFVAGGEVDLPQVGARGLRMQAGSDTLLVVAPHGDGAAAQALAKRGAHVFGLSIGVKDIDRAQRIVERGYGVELARYAGLDGNSVLAPTQDDLGLFIEFHALAKQ